MAKIRPFSENKAFFGGRGGGGGFQKDVESVKLSVASIRARTEQNQHLSVYVCLKKKNKVVSFSLFHTKNVNIQNC